MDHGKTESSVPKQSAYDESQELLSGISDDWTERLKPCDAGEREMPIGDALIHFDRYLANVCHMPTDRRRRLISSIL